MATNARKGITIHELCSISPTTPAAEHVLPLTFSDVIWAYFHPIQRLLFYNFPRPSTEFFESIVPHLKQSLSQTLTHYFPLAGNLILPPNNNSDTTKPQFRYTAAGTVAVTIAVATGDLDYNNLKGNHIREADDLHSLVPELPEPSIESESGAKIIPVFAIQITLFPQSGISIGFTNHHTIGDASSIVAFIKAWCSIAKLGFLPETHARPMYDRSVISDPTGRADIYWKQMKEFQIGNNDFKLPTNRVRSTFILTKTEIQLLKNLALAREPGLTHISSFAVTTAFVWSCLVKATVEDVDNEEAEYFGMAVDGRGRMEPAVPAEYFGNCLGVAVVNSTHGVLKGQNGYFEAVRLIGDTIGGKVNNKEELWRDADDWLVKFLPVLSKRCIGVAGSPKFDLYDADFGWGDPDKYESVSIDMDTSIALCKARGFEGGLEIGVSLPRQRMESMVDVFSSQLSQYVASNS